jgi:hypothetical protein
MERVMRFTALEVVLVYLGVSLVLFVFAAAALDGLIKKVINAYRRRLSRIA